MSSGQTAELATVIQNFLPGLQAVKPLPVNQLRTLLALQHCRTEKMGGRVEQCTCCGKEEVLYNSCRNRHCPKCGSIEREKWLISREADLLPVNYLHMVFTIPDKLNRLFLHHQVDCYNILFRVVNQVMTGFAANPDFLDARIGYTAILHPWGQNLSYHPHLHLVVPAGGITRNNRWKPARGDGKFLFPVGQLSHVFRAKMVAELRRYVRKENIIVEKGLFNSLFKTGWVVYAKPPFEGPKQVLSYLGRYTHRTAISNNRILKVNDENVVFSWHNYQNNYQQVITEIDGKTFLQRFCLHILPPGFTRIRHYGFMASAAKTKALAALRKYFHLPEPEKPGCTWQQIVKTRMNIQVGCCKSCGGMVETVRILLPFFHQPIRAPAKC